MNTSTQQLSNEVSDEEIEKAWGNANFGNVPKVDVIVDTLKKVAQAWSTGHTAMCIIKELGFVENRNNSIGLSDRGLSYLLKHSSTTSEPIKYEVAIGFAEFISGEGWQQYDGKDRWICPQNNNDVLSTKELFEKYNGSTTIEPIDNKIPIDATDLECFSIKGSEAFIGYKAPNGNFNFIQIPYTEPKKDIEELEEM